MPRFRRPYLRRPKPETVDTLSGVLIKFVGETVKDRFLRAILIGIISAGTYLLNDPETLMLLFPDDPPAVTAPAAAQ